MDHRLKTWLNQPSGSEIATEHAFAFCLPGIGQSKQIGTDKAHGGSGDSGTQGTWPHPARS